NRQERRALESLGINFDSAPSTATAVEMLELAHYAAIISNVPKPKEAGKDGPCFPNQTPQNQAHGAGGAMVTIIHEKYREKMPPVILYAGRFPEDVGTPPYAFGVTNRPDQLFQLVFDALERRSDETVTPI